VTGEGGSSGLRRDWLLTGDLLVTAALYDDAMASWQLDVAGFQRFVSDVDADGGAIDDAVNKMTAALDDCGGAVQSSSSVAQALSRFGSLRVKAAGEVRATLQDAANAAIETSVYVAVADDEMVENLREQRVMATSWMSVFE
jgi:hypothetical protein